jgi:hypothetical protein
MDQNERIRLLEAAVAELSSSLRIAAEDAERVAREAVDEHADAGSERTTRRGALRPLNGTNVSFPAAPGGWSTIANAPSGVDQSTGRGVVGVHDDGDSGTHFIIDITGYYL